MSSNDRAYSDSTERISHVPGHVPTGRNRLFDSVRSSFSKRVHLCDERIIFADWGSGREVKAAIKTRMHS